MTARVAAGVPAGGQFSASSRGAAQDVALGDNMPVSVDCPRCYASESSEVVAALGHCASCQNEDDQAEVASELSSDVEHVAVEGQEWHRVDSDERYPGQFVSHVGEQDGFRLRVDPGDNDTFDADGFSWSASNGQHAYSGTAATRLEAFREASAAADYVTSGQAEADWDDEA